MSNVILAYPDRSQVSASYTPAFSGGSWLSNLPLANLKNVLMSSKARSTNAQAASTKFDLNMGVARSIRCIGILRHNAGSAATIRVRAYSDSGYTSLVHDTGTLNFWDEGYPSAENKKRYQEDFYIILAADVSARYWRTEITDTANPDGYFELARAVFTPAFSPSVNMVFGAASIGLETDTARTRTRGGADYYDRSEPRRVARFTLPRLTETEGLGDVFDLQWDRGIDREILFVFDPADTGVMLKKRAWLGTLRQLSPIEYPYVAVNSTAFEVMEML